MRDSNEKKPLSGVQAVVEMFQHMNEPDRSRLLANLSERDPKLVAEIEKHLFSFEDLVTLSGREIQSLLPEVPSAKLALALRRASDALKAHLFSNMTERGRKALEEDIQALGPRRLSDIEAAQAEILRIARVLETQGKLLLTNRSAPRP